MATLLHFTHSHRLTKVYTDTEFLCDGCRTLGIGTRYRCESCDFDLHDQCATCPSELSSFMHEHDLKLVVRKPQPLCQNERLCDLCEEPVEGIFYRCKLCEFDVHPLCTQLPKHVRHVMHKAHPLRLQRSVPSRCAVCEDLCLSWHYRCGICSFDLHLECVLEPCEEEATPESTSRSFRRPVTPQPPLSPSPSQSQSQSVSPFSDAYNPYGYGAIQPAPYFAPPFFFPYPQGYGMIPSSSGGSVVNNHQHSDGQGQGQGQGGKGRVKKKMYAIAGNLALGVLSNLVFGGLGAVFS